MARKKKNVGGGAPVKLEPEKPEWGAAWYLRPLVLSLLGAVLFFFSFSPYGWSGLGWVATVPFLILVRQEKLAGRRPYLAIWFASSLAWLALVEGVRRPFWALYFGWFALAIYAAAYIPLFVGAARILVHRWKLPLAVGAPVTWCGLELVRGYLFSGFSVGLLAHTQFRQPLVIQVADLFGQCGVSFLVMAPAAAMVGLWPRSGFDFFHHEGTKDTKRKESRFGVALAWGGLLGAVALVVGALWYGGYRLRETEEIAKGAERLKVALVQGNVDVVFDVESDAYIKRQFQQCREMTVEALEMRPGTDLVVWPESCFLAGGFDARVTKPVKPLPDDMMSPEEFELAADYFAERCKQIVQRFQLDSGDVTPQAKYLVGSGTFEVGPGERRAPYNSALFLDAEGKLESRYYKMHRVMFGEYIPVVDLFPALYRFTPLPMAIQAGREPQALKVKDWTLCPNICFESTVPQLLRHQAQFLANRAEPVDAFVNLTNDGWFWGSGVQDLHLHCAIFRAVEQRRPVVTAANSGFAVHCDAAGRVLAVGKRRKAEVLAVTLTKDSRQTLYYWWGDWPMSSCLLLTVGGLVIEGLIRRGWLGMGRKD